MKTVTIRRVPSLNFRTGKVKIFSGQKEIAIINDYEKEIKVDIDENKKIWAKLQFCSSNKIQINNNTEEVLLTSFLTDKSFIIILGAILLCTFISIFTELTFFGFFPIIILLYPLYYITIGRSKYLRMSLKNAK